jgi:nitrate/nitrite transporter NarK
MGEELGAKKKLMGDIIKRNIFPILIVAFSGAIIYGLPYFRYEYYDAYMDIYNLSNTQMGLFSTIFGIFGVISYLFGGMLADRISVKILLAFSLFGTAIGGVIHLMDLSFGALAVLYAFWGFTSLFAFWPASVKAIRMMAESGDQGKAFGIFEGSRGVFAAVVAILAVLFFSIGNNKLGDALGLRYLLIYYAIGCAVTGVLVLLFFKEDKTVIAKDPDQDSKIRLKDIGAVIKMPAVWIIAIVTLCGYVYTMSLYYFTPYSTEFFGISTTAAATIAALRRWVSPVATGGAGFLIDKIGTGRMFFISFVVMAASICGILILPGKASMLVPFIALYMICYFFYCANYGLTWSMMDEGKIPVKLSGTAAGVIATIGYLPEVFCPPIAGVTLDAHAGKTGYTMYFTFVVVALVVGAVFTIIWQRYLKKKNASELPVASDGAES